MVLCKRFLEGLDCPYPCQDEHLDLKEFILTEMEAAINGGQWRLSSFGPFVGKPSIPNYIEDQSFEEIRLLYYSSNNKNFIACCQQFGKALTLAKHKTKLLFTMNNEVMEVLVDLYNSPEPQKQKKNPFDLIPLTISEPGVNLFGRSGNTSSEVVFFTEVQKSVLSPSSSSGFEGQQSQTAQANNSAQAGQQTPVAKQGCSDCKEYLKEILKKMDSILSALNENNAKLKTQEEELKYVIDSIKYMSVDEQTEIQQQKQVENKDNTKVPEKSVSRLIINPKRKQSFREIIDEIKESIDPLELCLQINGMFRYKNESVVIICKDDDSGKRLEVELKKKCGELYDVHLKPAYHTVMVNGIDKKVVKKDLPEIIRKQNNLIGEMKFIKSQKVKNSRHRYNAVIKMDRNLYNLLMKDTKPFVNIGWNKCYVHDFHTPVKCFHCWGSEYREIYCTNCKKCRECEEKFERELIKYKIAVRKLK